MDNKLVELMADLMEEVVQILQPHCSKLKARNDPIGFEIPELAAH